jgi:hypothetical protein
MIDASVARCVADIVEQLADLNNAVGDIKWRLMRGESEEMRGPARVARKAINALKEQVGSLHYRIEAAREESDGEEDETQAEAKAEGAHPVGG